MVARRLVALAVVVLGAAVHCTVTSSDDSRAIAVEVGVASTPGPSETSTDRGFEVTLERALVAFETIEILPCESAAEAGLLQALGVVGVAHAHSQVSPTRTGIPAVLPLASAERTDVGVGTLEPPPGGYCAARIKLGAADSDAVGMPDDGAMVGLTLLVEGSFVTDGGAPTPFRLHSTATATVDVPLDLTLGEDGRQTAALRVVVDGGRLLDGLDLATVDGQAGGDAALAALAQLVVVVIE